MSDQTYLSDPQLAARAESGDFEAFRAIVHRYSNALLSVAYSVLGDYHEAQDAVQEAFAKSYSRLHTLKDKKRLGSWLYTIVHRTSIDMKRAQRTSLPLDEALTPTSDLIHSWLERHALQEAVWTAMHSLEEKSKTAVILYYVSDWPMKEIGRFLNLSLSAVESRIRRARESLKRQLAGDYESYFRSCRLGLPFEERVSQHVLKRMGHFYIPATNKERTTEWFIIHFQLQRAPHGSLWLGTGQQLFVLECSNHTPPAQPLLTFAVDDVEACWAQLNTSGVVTGPIAEDEWWGSHFVFYDFDGNKYIAVTPK
ncbi:sigma-70 family RNA polymerase sigma factor [Paenibacillus tarimensis]|uniref:sigma-70 family RNA polymerase sigma factor n=1 Tax=Paenibacillus tarimensis TaxID=416012 RepID=UPI001F171C15|nr:sigma-70 family RNA polymerase sigma factor [Paenibacillus tarimensis]MCF2944399.1 sigma-70 family RNA polymerase sigma factor [Paenibacillus tarimensis]